MSLRTSRFLFPAVILVILCVIFAGCTSEKADAQPTPATTVPTKSVAKGLTPFPTPTEVIVQDDGSKTCSQLQGTVAIPGQACPGTWLTVSDSFSCCSKTPVAGTITNPRLAVEPLDLRIIHNDTFVALGTV
jgi:hypothetical protein